VSEVCENLSFKEKSSNENKRLKMLYDIYEKNKNIAYSSNIEATDEEYRKFCP